VDIAKLTPEERIELIGRLWDSLEPDEAAPMSSALEAELIQRVAESDADPDGGEDWESIKQELRSRLRKEGLSKRTPT
jgi:putative addiction module component (TIGR02574 family)